MSKNGVICAVATYFGIAAVLAAIVLLATPETADTRTAVLVGSFLGIAVLTPALAGTLPLIFWGFGRFRPQTARGPIIAWVFIGAVFMFGGTAEDFYEGKLALRNISPNVSALFSSDTETFIRIVKTSCVKSRGSNSRSTLSDQAFAAFCQCYAEALFRELTPQEFAFTLDARVMPSPTPVWMREKTGRAAIACQRLAVSHERN